MALTIAPAPRALAQLGTAAGPTRPVAIATEPPDGATALRLHLADLREGAFERVVNALEAAGYRMERMEPDDGTLMTRFRYVRGAGLVRVSAAVIPDSGGAVVLQLSGAVRRLRRLGLVSAAGAVEPITYGERNPRQRTAWQELEDLGRGFSPRRITYATSP